MTQFFGSVWWLIVPLGVLITFHEYGHFVVARRCGVKVLRFSVGFGKPLWRRVDRHGTEFVIAAIPLGGYVKMLDERESGEQLPPQEQAFAFNRKPVLQRMAIAAAGPAFNLIFALAAFWLMFLVGRPDYQPVIAAPTGVAAQSGFLAGDQLLSVGGDNVDSWSAAISALAQSALAYQDVRLEVRDAQGQQHERTLALSTLPHDVADTELLQAMGLRLRPPEVAPIAETVAKDSAAAEAGLLAGDRILSINDQPINHYIEIAPTIQKLAASNPRLSLRIDRAGSTQTVPVTVREQTLENGESRWILGIQAPDTHDALLRHGPLAAIPAAFAETWKSTKATLGVIKSMLTGAISAKNLSGVITIAQVANTSAQMGPAWFFSFLALISLNLAVLNLLPIPVLDGGHLLYYLIELVKGSPVSERTQMAGQYVGVVLLVALMGLALFNDILRLAS